MKHAEKTMKRSLCLPSQLVLAACFAAAFFGGAMAAETASNRTPARVDAFTPEVHGAFSTRFEGNLMRGAFPVGDTNASAANQAGERGDRLLWVRGLLRGELARDFSFEASGSFRSDLGSGTNGRFFNPLANIYTGQLGFGNEAFLDTAFVTFTRSFGSAAFALDEIKFGRFYRAELGSLPLDGAGVSLSVAKRLSVKLYGGVLSPFYELQDAWGSDWTVGADLRLKIASGMSATVDYQFLRSAQYPVDAAVVTMDHRLGAGFSHRIGSILGYQASFRALDFSPFDARVRVDSTLEKIGLDLHLSGVARFATTNSNFVNPANPYFTGVMGASKPFCSVDLSASKALGRYLSVDGGYFFRGLFTTNDASAFNRSYMRGFLAVAVHPILDALTVSATGDVWASAPRVSFSGGFDVSYDERLRPGPGGRIKLSAGTYFSYYAYDTVLLGSATGTNWIEKVDVRTWYAKAQIPLAAGLSLDARYEFEQGIDISHHFRAGINYEF